jgi:hypothetical protein
MKHVEARACATPGVGDNGPAEGAVWPIQRVLFLMAGTVTLTGTVLAIAVSRWFLILPALAGANQLLMVAVGWCPMSMLLTRVRQRPNRTAVPR